MKYLTFLMLCIGNIAFAQLNYEPGYFKTTNGTTTECLIKNLAWKNNPVTFDYKTGADTETQTAGIEGIQEFEVSGYKFEKHTVAIDRTSFDTNSLGIKKDPVFNTEILFLKVLTEGPATLYEYTDGNIVRYFFAKNTQAPQQLVYIEYKNDAAIKYNFMFRQQLYNIMSDKITDRKAFEIKYKKDQLLTLFTQYNGSNGNTLNYTARQNKTTLHLKITPGINFAQLNAKRVASPADVVSNFDNKAIARIGLELELVLPFNNKKWAIFTDPNYSKYSNNYTTSNSGTTENWKASYSSIEIPVGVRHYMFLSNRSKLFVNASYAFAFSLSKGQLHLDYSSPFSTFSHYPDFNPSSNAAAGIGYNYTNFSLEARYSFNRNILAKHVAWTGNYSTVGIILGYKFL